MASLDSPTKRKLAASFDIYEDPDSTGSSQVRFRATTGMPDTEQLQRVKRGASSALLPLITSKSANQQASPKVCRSFVFFIHLPNANGSAEVRAR